MKKILGLFLMILFSSSVYAAESVAQKVRNALNEFAWEKRQLIVFSPSKEHAEYQRFKSIELEFNDEFKERRLQSWHVIANDSVKLDSVTRGDILTQDFRDRYNVDTNEFRLLLIGYDQGEKLRLKKVSIDYLFSQIDQMPMRVQEMQ